MLTAQLIFVHLRDTQAYSINVCVKKLSLEKGQSAGRGLIIKSDGLVSLYRYHCQTIIFSLSTLNFLIKIRLRKNENFNAKLVFDDIDFGFFKILKFLRFENVI